MNRLKLVFPILLFAMATFIFACGSGSENKAEGVSETGPEYTSAYVCPMHCKGSGSDKAGTCPVCHMDYVAKEDAKEEEHGHDHDGHDHSHEGHSH